MADWTFSSFTQPMSGYTSHNYANALTKNAYTVRQMMCQTRLAITGCESELVYNDAELDSISSQRSGNYVEFVRRASKRMHER